MFQSMSLIAAGHQVDFAAFPELLHFADTMRFYGTSGAYRVLRGVGNKRDTTANRTTTLFGEAAAVRHNTGLPGTDTLRRFFRHDMQTMGVDDERLTAFHHDVFQLQQDLGAKASPFILLATDERHLSNGTYWYEPSDSYIGGRIKGSDHYMTLEEAEKLFAECVVNGEPDIDKFVKGIELDSGISEVRLTTLDGRVHSFVACFSTKDDVAHLKAIVDSLHSCLQCRLDRHDCDNFGGICSHCAREDRECHRLRLFGVCSDLDSSARKAVQELGLLFIGDSPHLLKAVLALLGNWYIVDHMGRVMSRWALRTE
jgi:hypothetical protein